MMPKLPEQFIINRELAIARQSGVPVVALESAVITHGLPRPENLSLAQEMEAIVRDNGAVPATIALLDGKIRIGLTDNALKNLAGLEDSRKISLRDFGIALSRGLSGGTTVAATLFAAEKAGIQVFATGGIGGIQRGAPFDISADLPQLGRSKLVVVCAGAKAILDLPATREYLETQGVPVIGYQTDEFPAFYTAHSGLKVDFAVDSPEQAAQIARQAWAAGLSSAVLLVVPPPEETISASEIETAIQEALDQAQQAGVHGAETTPFLLNRVSELTAGRSKLANLALLKNNARVAAQVAVALEGVIGNRI